MLLLAGKLLPLTRLRGCIDFATLEPVDFFPQEFRVRENVADLSHEC